MLVLAIESSCDETAASVVRDGREILSSVVASQVEVHAEYGGVVPEIASRRHMEAIVPVIDESLERAGVTFPMIEGIAVTQGPGLAGALLVGLSTAKAIAFAEGIPIIGVNHIEGHLLAIFLEHEVAFPYIALVVSGGHTHLYKVTGPGRYRTLGQTLDDAAGEAFDKVAKLLGLPYPGGAVIDRLSEDGNPCAITLPRPLIHDNSFNFSFSGLKTAVLNYLNRNPDARVYGRINDLCASFQRAVCEVLTVKAASAVSKTGIKRLVVAGGVACNRGLRTEMGKMATEMGVELHIPSPSLCADNAAMIAVPGDFYLSRGITSGDDLDALTVWPLDLLTERLS
jgi:N6-L-threonylcarbamoyladenine synthase